MSESFGPGVSRVLSPADTAFETVIWQAGKPPLDSEFNLLQQIVAHRIRMRSPLSGWVSSPVNASSVFQTDKDWSNWFQFGNQRNGETRSIPFASVNGWLVAVTGTATGTPPGSPDNVSTWNRVTLPPPPANAGDTRVDFVFLEVWQARLSPITSSNKPSSSAVYRFGNVEGGSSYLPDESLDPAIGFETTERVQVQYRIRVVAGVGLSANPDGFDPATVKAQGTAGSVSSFTFSNMRVILGDPGLWRAGDGNPNNSLGTVDGYTYAIPICAVFRRNSVVWSGAPSLNLNGGTNRNPTAVDRSGWKTFVNASLSATVNATATVFPLVTATNISIPSAPLSPFLAKINDEYVTVTAITGLNATVTRGVNGSEAVSHPSGSVITPVSSRPDGLFSDQVARTDILDLRHCLLENVDFSTILKENLNKLFKGQLQSTWKRNGGNTQGSFLLYQDKVSATPTLGLTKLDTPDNHRTVWSDASIMQRYVAYVRPAAAPIGSSTPVQVSWGQTVDVNCTLQSVADQFSPNDVLVIPIAQFKSGLGLDTDQARFVTGETFTAVSVYDEGNNSPVVFTPSPSNPGTGDDLIITFNDEAGGPSPVRSVIIVFTVLYGGGRGLGLRPDATHQIAMQTNSGADYLLPLATVLTNNYPLQTAWALLDSSFRKEPYAGSLPVLAESYVDPGSKTVKIKPFKRVPIPTLLTSDGYATNLNPSFVTDGGTGETFGTDIFEDLSVNFTTAGVTAGMVLTIVNGNNTGKYTIVTVAPGGNNNRVQVTRNLQTSVFQVWTVQESLGLMPTVAADGITPKWTTTDPLELFAGSVTGTNNNAVQKNLYCSLPRLFVNGWGEVRLPLLWKDADSDVFHEGVNFLLMSKKNPSGPINDADQSRQFINYLNGSLSYAVFSTHDLNALGSSVPFNSAYTYSGFSVAGVRFFTDSRGFNRTGLELPPFYGIARLFAVYEASDYVTNGSAYNSSTRAGLTVGTPAVNLLRSSFDGPLFWIEKDDDGDSTFILNAEALDLTKSPTPISSFASGKFVIEASIFGFDRGSFDLDQEFRLVLSRPTSGGRTVATDPGVRANNLSVEISGPNLIIPAPLTASDTAVVTYSRTPYQGDPFGAQTTQNDISPLRGPLTSSAAYDVVGTQLDQDNIVRDNEKVLTVLAGTLFATTLGTGRVSGDLPPSGAMDIRQVGMESPLGYPPSSGSDPRPDLIPATLTGFLGNPTVSPVYGGLTERLPLGSLFRDKDFRGNRFILSGSGIVFLDQEGVAPGFTNLAASSLEVTDPLNIAGEPGSGSPGTVLVHVDGSVTTSQNTKFRTTRGGSVFVGSGSHPGSEFATVAENADLSTSPNALYGVAMLVRGDPLVVGGNEVSAGNELFLLIVTSTVRAPFPGSVEALLQNGTNGLGEGYSAVDVFRVEGHPLVQHPTNDFIDPSTVTLAKRVSP